MKILHTILLTIIFSFFFGCANDESNLPQKQKVVTLTYDFISNRQNWEGDFTDYPNGEEDFYEFLFEYSTLPDPLNTSKRALKQSGNNHSDDLFMFIKTKIKGLKINTSYDANFHIEIATNVPKNSLGVGGSPGESVYIKAGLTNREPKKILINNYYELNIDKGPQSNSGKDMVVIGDFSNESDSNLYKLKALKSNIPFQAMSDSNGELWLIIGVDSGFESTTTIYYNKIQVILNEK